MDIKNILSRVDHTLLSQTATKEQIKQICEDAIEFKTASVCIPPNFVKFASEFIRGKVKVCTVIGFPNGYNETSVKVFETREAVLNGADEIDMVINIGDLKSKEYDKILNEINSIKKECGVRVLKVIIETCLLSESEKIKICGIVSASDADYIKTSTGFSEYGATKEDVLLLKKHMTNGKKIKAAGGISSLADAEMFIEAGADRLGTSKVVKLVKEMYQ